MNINKRTPDPKKEDLRTPTERQPNARNDEKPPNLAKNKDFTLGVRCSQKDQEGEMKKKKIMSSLFHYKKLNYEPHSTI